MFSILEWMTVYYLHTYSFLSAFWIHSNCRPITAACTSDHQRNGRSPSNSSIDYYSHITKRSSRLTLLGPTLAGICSKFDILPIVVLSVVTVVKVTTDWQLSSAVWMKRQVWHRGWRTKGRGVRRPRKFRRASTNVQHAKSCNYHCYIGWQALGHGDVR